MYANKAFGSIRSFREGKLPPVTVRGMVRRLEVEVNLLLDDEVPFSVSEILKLVNRLEEWKFVGLRSLRVEIVSRRSSWALDEKHVQHIRGWLERSPLQLKLKSLEKCELVVLVDGGEVVVHSGSNI